MSFDYDPALDRHDHSAARLDATLLRFSLDGAVVRALLARRGLTLIEPARSQQRHVATLELWRVSEGELAIGPVAWRDACAVAGAAISSLPAACAYASLRALSRDSPTPSRALASAERAVQVAGTFGASWARAAAESCVREFGRYHEVLLTIPDVRSPESGVACQWVVGMYTDSPLSRTGSLLFGFGFDKRAARIERTGFAYYRVWTKRTELVDAQFSSVRDSGALAEDWCAQLDQPLLAIRGRRAVVCRLTRHWNAAHVAVSGARGCIAVGAESRWRWLRGSHAIGASPAVDGVHVAGLPVRLSYPWSERATGSNTASGA